MQKRWIPFFWVCAALISGTMGTALASPLYPLYQQLWQLQPSDITTMFIAYMGGTLLSILFLGRLSDSLGFAKVLRAGLLLVLMGVGLSAFAQNAFMLSCARVIIGIASGLISTSGMMGMLQTSPLPSEAQTARWYASLNGLGFGMGPLIGGLVAQISGGSVLLPYLPVMLLTAVVLYQMWRIPFHAPSAPKPLDFKPRLALPEVGLGRKQFYLAAAGAFAAFAMFSLYASLAGSFIAEFLPWHGPLVSGSAIAMVLFLSSATQFFLRRLSLAKTYAAATAMILVANVMLVLTLELHSLPLFLLSIVATAMAHGLTLMAGFGKVQDITHSHNRAAVVSTFLVSGYCGAILPVMALGWLADHLGISTAVIIYCAVFALWAIALFTGFVRLKRQRATQTI